MSSSTGVIPRGDEGQTSHTTLPGVPGNIQTHLAIKDSSKNNCAVPLSIHSEEKWESLRPVITAYYIKDARPLESVMGIMVEKHQFKAR
jgi:hypothetical protein